MVIYLFSYALRNFSFKSHFMKQKDGELSDNEKNCTVGICRMH
jgi:hypothetical protein